MSAEPTKVQRLRELAEKATPRPWMVTDRDCTTQVIKADGDEVAETVISEADADLIVAAVHALPALLDLAAAAKAAYEGVCASNCTFTPLVIDILDALDRLEAVDG